jgi:DNA invertase Pin-like site-specific DNA recombinase
MPRKAIAYVSDIILGRTGEVISREAQKTAIRQHAAEAGIEIVSWFEDEAYNEDIVGRDGIRALFASASAGEILLVERVWALSRNWKALEAFMSELDYRGMKLESATTLWDCTSQRARQFHADRKASRPTVCPLVPAPDTAREIARPEHLFFSGLARKAVGA